MSIQHGDGRLPESFWVKAIENFATGCWEWTGADNGCGYGITSSGGVRVYTHRLSHEVFIGPIPNGLTIDHLCRNPTCCNPAHLEAVTMAENTRRGRQGEVTRARHAAKTHCPKGHPYDEENTIPYVKAGYACRACGACRREAAERKCARDTAARRAAWRADPPMCQDCGIAPVKGVRSKRCAGCHVAAAKAGDRARYLAKVAATQAEAATG